MLHTFSTIKDMPSGAKIPLMVAREFAKPVIRPANAGATYNILGQYAPANAMSVVIPMHTVKQTTSER